MRQILVFIVYTLTFSPFYLQADNTPTRNNRPIISENEPAEGAVIAKKSEKENQNDVECQSHLEFEPSAIVNECVNVITGTYIDFETDYIVPGAETLSFQRNYVSAPTYEKGPLGQGWNRNHYGYIFKYVAVDKGRPNRAYVHDALGSVYHYGQRHKKEYVLFSEGFEKYVTNSSSGGMSEQTNILNNNLEFRHYSEDLKSIEEATYKKCSGEKLILKGYMGTRGDHHYLSEVHKTNGNCLKYTYNEKYKLLNVEAFGNRGQSLGILEYEYSNADQIELKHNGQQKVLYRLQEFKGKTEEKASYVVASERKHAPNITYKYETKEDRAKVPKIIRKDLPENRFQEIEYYMRGSNEIGKFHHQAHGHNSPWVGRVKILKAPVGKDATPIITHKFLYNNLRNNSGSAEVYDAYDHLAKYKWDSNKRLCALKRYSGNSQYDLVCVDRMYWGVDSSKDEILLSTRTCENALGEIQYIRDFDYDTYGNVLADRLHGNLSGTNQKPCSVSSKGNVIDTGCERYVKHFSYYKEGRHLLKESTENGVTQVFKYKDDTDLLASKFYKYKDKIFKREFYDYDENATVILTIEDDGSSTNRNSLEGLTERRIRRTTSQTIAPVGLPWIIEEKYLDLKTGKEKLFRKTVNHYCRNGHLISKELYDCKERLLGILTMDYDAHGNLTREVDIIGRETIRFYDANDNKVFEKLTNAHVHKEFFYDFSNRLIKVEEVHDNGLRLAELYTYDYLGHKVSSIDIYGNETRYVYDDFGRLAKTILPKVTLDKDVVGTSQNFTKYNLFNVPESCTDFNGNTTAIECNIRGKPTQKVYPDGTQEAFLYNLDGSLQRHTHANGSYTSYEYDHLSRPLSNITYDKNGKVLTSKKYTYNTFHLLSETDAGGHVQNFRYNAAGRLVEAIKGERRITYSYDASGRLYKTTEHDGKGKSVSYIQKFDLLDRVIEERQEDHLNNVLTKVSYGYDDYGNRTHVTTYAEGVESTTITTYDSRHQPTKIVDPMGNVTHIVYRYDYKNKLGQTVAYSASTDPMGNVTVNIKDAKGNLVWLNQTNCLGEILHKKCIYYDKNGNKCKQIDHSTIMPGTLNDPIVTTWSYDCMNRLTGITEAVGAPEQKQTEVRYNQFGQQSEIIKADSVRIQTSYDALGRQIRKYSTDGSVDDHYTYDASGNISAVEDKVNNVKTVRTFDAVNRLAKEKLANELAVSYTYDALNNPHILTFPDKTGVEYVYNCKRLQAVHRLSEDKKRKYTHKYAAYDLQDKLTEAILIRKAGKGHYTYDAKGRSTGLEYSCWNEEINSYDKVGNILSRSIKEPTKTTNCSYSYDDLYQITKESGVAKHTYNFDSLNNRTKKDGKNLKLNKLNQLLSSPDTQYSYDLNGNLIQRVNAEETQTLKYDALDRLILVTSKNKRTAFRYDAQNRRLTKRVDKKNDQTKGWDKGKTHKFLYVGQNEVGCYNSLGEAFEFRILGLSKGAEIGAAVAVELAGKVYAPVHDHNGNVTALVDAETGKGCEFYRYTAFGEETLLNESGEEIAVSKNPWRFSSKRLDNETGFVYFGRRYYEPETGRWITPDPIGHADGLNVYAFVHNRTLTMFDLYGLTGVEGGRSWSFGNNAFGHSMDIGFTYLGRAINLIAFHFVPVPIVKDLIRLIGIAMAGDSFDEYHVTFFGKHSYGNLGRPEPGTHNGRNHLILVEGGICCTENDMIKRAEATSDALGGCNVHHFAYSTDGFVLDVGKAFLRRCGIMLTGDKEMGAHKERIINEAGGPENVLVHAKIHSQAGIVQDNFRGHTSAEIPKCMRIYSLGIASVQNNGDYASVKNFISENDIVPMISDPFTYFPARFFQPRGDVFFLPSKTLPLMDHGWGGSTYQKVDAYVNNLIREEIWGIK